MIKLRGWWVWVVCVALASLMNGCNGPVEGLYPPGQGEDFKTIYVMSNHWHTGFVLELEDMPWRYRRAFSTFEKYQYVEVGWGDDLFYRAKKGTVWLGVQAAFVSPRAVMHVVGIEPDPVTHYGELDCELYRIKVSKAGYNRLIKYVYDSFETDDQSMPIEVQKGLYGFSRFYKAKGYYCIGHTCNHWAADGLRETGFGVTPMWAFMADNLCMQIRRNGEKDVDALRESR